MPRSSKSRRGVAAGRPEDREPGVQRPLPKELQEAASRLAAHFNAGEDEHVEALAKPLLGRHPRWGFGWMAIGASLLRRGKLDEAIECLKKSAQSSPADAEAHRRLGAALKARGDLDGSIAAYRQALELRPDHAETCNNLGNALLARGRLEEAIAAFRQALSLKSTYPEAHYNLGIALKATGELDGAIAAYRTALAIKPDYAEAHNNLGNALQAVGELDDAIAAYRSALASKSDYAEPWNNLGNALLYRGETNDALAAYHRALELKPDYADAHMNLGNALGSLDRHEEAAAHYERALAIRPAFAKAHCNLGNLLMTLGRHREAEASFREALALEPGHGTALSMVTHATRCTHAWSRLTEDSENLKMSVRCDEAIEIPTLPLCAIPDITPIDQKRAGSNYAVIRHQAGLNSRRLVPAGARCAHDRLRIGYLSADFHEHATMHLLAGVLENHDRRRVAIYAYSYGPEKNGPMRQRAVQACDVFRDIRALSHEAAARQIVEDGVDLLVDLKGYTKDARPGITVLRPAPLIVSWLGYPGTLGHPRLADYIIGDPVVTPLEHRDHFSETLAQMPHCYQPNDRARPIGPQPSRQAAGLPETGFVFCSFNQGFKLGPETFDIWCRLLGEVADSVLWLLEPTPDAIANLRREAMQRGLDPDRLIFAPKTSPTEHLGRMQWADLALDTFPYTSHTTGSDALWVGVPLVTRIGETFASRVGASLLHAAGLPELITTSPEDYFTLARNLASDSGRLTALRARLLANRATMPLFDTEQFTRDLEALYFRMDDQHRRDSREPILAEQIFNAPSAGSLPGESE